jgi:hypothetical protein
VKVFLALLSIIGVVVLAISIGNRIPPDTVAMAIGVVLGALSTIPVSLLIGALMARSRAVPAPAAVEPVYPVAAQPPYPRSDAYNALADYPPVVILNSGQFQAPRQPAYAPAQMSQQSPQIGSPRNFRIVGEEGT